MGQPALSRPVTGVLSGAFILRIFARGDEGAAPLAAGEIAGIAGGPTGAVAAEPVGAESGDAFAGQAARRSQVQAALPRSVADLGAGAFAVRIQTGSDRAADPLAASQAAGGAIGIASLVAAAAVDAESAQAVGGERAGLAVAEQA